MLRATLGAVCLLGAGCVTAGQGEAMRAETARLKTRLDEMEERYKNSNEQMDRLRKVLDEATALLTRNSADLGAKVQKAELEQASLGGRLEEAQHLLDQLQRSLADQSNRLAALETGQQKIVERVAPTMPEDKDGLWREAQARLTSGQREEARRFLRAYVQRFPQDPRAGEAQLAVGKSYTAEQRHTQAAAEYQKVLDSYPKSPAVPEAMWSLALAFIELKFCGDARAIFLDMAKRYPHSPHAAEAKTKAKDLVRLAKDRDRCTS